MTNRRCPLCRGTKVRNKFQVDAFGIVACQKCGFVFLANPAPPENEQENYESYFKSSQLADYTKDSSDAAIREAWRINEQRIAWVKQFTAGGRLLDIGCGRGFFLSHARKNGFDVRGVEISVSAAKYASEHFGVPVHICNLDVENNMDESYDVVTLWHVLEHFHDPRAVLENVRRLLKPGGRLFIEVPNLNSLKFRLSTPGRRWQGGNHPRYHRSFFTRKTLRRVLQTCGFDIDNTPPVNYDLQSNPAVRRAKHCLNAFHLDSFLNETATAGH